MIGFEYKYNSPTEVFHNITFMTHYSIVEYLILFLLIAGLIGALHYGLPIINLFKHYKKQTTEKNNRTKFIKQIALQKDIEAEIEEELNI